MREKKKGFTLIELLAVIVILAIVSLIATPIVLNLINVAKQGAFKRSAEGALKSAKLYYSSSLLQVSGPEDIIFTCHNNECISNNNGKQEKLEISGNVGDGYVKIYSDGDVEMLVTDENHYAAKTKVGDITVDKGNGSNVDLTNDTTSPIINSVNTSVTTNSITVTVGAKDNESGIYGYEYSIDNGVTYTEIQRNNIYTFEGLTNNKTYEVRVKVYNGTYGKDTYSDEKGMSQSESKQVSLKAIDTPEIKVTPEGWSLEKEITIDYKGAQIKEYSLDNGQTYVEYTGPFKITENINIVAKASDGQNEVTITETISKIDRELPTVEVSDINTSYETKDEITLTLKDNLSGVTHYCVTSESTSDNCNWISGSGTVTHTINTNGTYYAYSKDLVGNISEGKEFVIDKVDTESPSASLEVTSKTTNSITVKAVCTDNVGITKYEYSKDNGVSYETGENETYTFSALTTGTYNMKVRCSDEAGNSAVGNVTINTEDLGVPSISVSNSGVWSTSKTVTIDYNDTINVNEYRIESGSATKEDGTALIVGTWYQTSNQIEKVIFTSNGNISVRKSDGTNTLTPVSQNVSMIDTTAPTIVANAYVYSATPNSDGYTDTGELISEYSSNQEGETIFDYTNTGINFRTQFIDDESGIKSSVLYWDNVYYPYDPGKDFYEKGLGKVINVDVQEFFAGEGYRRGRFVVEDNAGNTTIYHVAVLIDKTVPTVSYSVTGGTYNSYQTVMVTANDTNYSYMNVHLYKDGVYDTTKSKTIKGSSTYQVELDNDGLWILYTRVYDEAGNIQTQEPQNNDGYYYQKYLIDATAPSAPTYDAYYEDGSGSYTSGTWTNKNVFTKISSNDSGSGVSYIQYSKDKIEWSTFNFGIQKLTQNGITWTGIEPWGLHDRDDVYYFRAIDNAGNVSDVSTSYNIKYDTALPTISLDGVPSQITLGDSYALPTSYTVNNNLSGGSAVCKDGNTVVTNTSSLSVGEHTITCTVTTGAGTSATVSKTIDITNTAYTITNIITNGSFENISEISCTARNHGVMNCLSTKYVRTGSNSVMLTGFADAPETLVNVETDQELNNEHIYYAIVYGYQESDIFDFSTNIYWPIQEPSMGLQQKSKIVNSNKWNKYAFYGSRKQFDNGMYAARLDFDNNYVDGTIWYDDAALVDLTETFGEGNEPDIQWCDKHIDYFDGTITIYK